MTWSLIGGFVLAVALGAMVPGPTTALVIRRSAVGGARKTIPVVAGMEIGLYVWAMATAIGVGISGAPVTWGPVKYIGRFGCMPG